MSKTEKYAGDSTDSVDELDFEKEDSDKLDHDLERRRGDIRLKQLGIGQIENARFRHKWWQLW